jgi:hypothetical protein
MNFSALRRQIAQLKAAMPTKPRPVVAIFWSADGTLEGNNAARLRAAKAANAHIINVRFMRTPREELSL